LLAVVLALSPAGSYLTSFLRRWSGLWADASASFLVSSSLESPFDFSGFPRHCSDNRLDSLAHPIPLAVFSFPPRENFLNSRRAQRTTGCASIGHVVVRGLSAPTGPGGVPCASIRRSSRFPEACGAGHRRRPVRRRPVAPLEIASASASPPALQLGDRALRSRPKRGGFAGFASPAHSPTFPCRYAPRPFGLGPSEGAFASSDRESPCWICSSNQLPSG
jgi:hypothetical protein